MSTTSPIPPHLNIVALETCFTPLPKLTLPPPHEFSLTAYTRTSQAELPGRVSNAHILITTTIALGADVLSPQCTPNLVLIAVTASGTDSINLAACRRRGIRVLSSPDCNAQAVAEHTLALYFAVRRKVLPTMAALRDGEWCRQGTLMTKACDRTGQQPMGCGGEVVAIVGHGSVGRRVERLCRALGMKVVVASRKQAEPESAGEKKGRTGMVGGDAQGERPSFEEALHMASVVVLSCPRTPETLGLLSRAEFALMREQAVLVNVSRGGVVDEDALLDALTRGQIAGAGVDVYGTEPAGPETSPLLGAGAQGLNLVTTPHTAWLGEETTANYQRVLQENINCLLTDQVPLDRIKA